MSKQVNHWKVLERMPRSILAIAFAALTPLATAQAASISYFLDQANALPGGTNYLQVTLTETDTGVDFLVETLEPLDSVAADNFGIQEFGFNFTSKMPYDAITGLPDNWRVANDKQMSEFGRYGIVLKSRGNTRADTLRVSILGADLDLTDFDDFFSAHVAGLDWNAGNGGISSPTAQSLTLQDQDITGSEDNKGCYTNNCITSSYFGGGTPAAVPIPPAAWLFGSGLLGMVSVARRRVHAA